MAEAQELRLQYSHRHRITDLETTIKAIERARDKHGRK